MKHFFPIPGRGSLTKLSGVLMFCVVAYLQLPTAHALTFKIATLSPDGSSWMKLMRAGADEAKQKTEGRVSFKFYPGGVMGDEKAILRKMRIGQLHGGAMTSGSLAQFYSDNQIYNLPVVFNSFDEVDHVRAQMDPAIVDGLYQNGMVTFGLAEGGFAYLMSKTPIYNVADLRKRKVWIPAGDTIAVETARVFDLAPIPLSPAEVRTGLQTGLIDTVAASPIIAIALRWHTQIEYITDNPLIYIYGVLAIDRRTFEKLSIEDQETVNSVMRAVWRKIDRQNRDENIKALEALANQGIQFIKMDVADKNELQRIAAGVPAQMIKAGILSQSIVDQLNQNLSEYRTGKTSAK